MAKSWTKEERKKFLSERRHEPREKAIVLAVLFIIIAVFLVTIYLSLVYRLEPWIPIILVIGLFAAIVFATFFVDFIFYESQ